MCAYYNSAHLSIEKYEGIMRDHVNDTRDTASYIVVKNHPFLTTLAAPGRPRGFFYQCFVSISLNYYDDKLSAVSNDPVSFVKTFPV